MSKYIVSFLAITLCVAPCFADDPVVVNTTAQHFLTAVTDKINAYSTQGMMPADFDKDGYLSTLTSLAAEIGETQSLPMTTAAIDAYVAGVDAKVTAMNNKLGDYEEVGTYADEFMDKTVFFVEEYLKDMKNNVTGIDTGQYLNDMQRIYDRTVANLEELNNPSNEGEGQTIFNPGEHLDKATGSQKTAAKIELIWAGVGNHWLNSNLGALINAFKVKYGSDSVAQQDFGLLQELWPQTAEVFLMNTAYNADWYSGASRQNEMNGVYSNSYVVNEYCELANEEDYSEELTATSSTGRTDTTEYGGQDDTTYSTYNNRAWGYDYSDGIHTTVKVTTNGREYVLQEDIFTSPLVLDLDGDGAIEASKGVWLPHRYAGAKVVEFDMIGDGFTDITEWVGPNDGLLVVYNGEREVDANALFGTAGGYSHGYEKLSLLDKNADAKISGEELDTLSVWADKNGDAKPDKGEIASVKSMGITEISLNYDDNLVSSFVQNGKTRKMFDWFPHVLIVKKKK